ncbi:hypothetical protein [Crocosphaera chwakensis]|uniref:Uncharacterized protein n=1 Tax=Crocosphaera chwakensis CCY0110 TaxID=391612 RepID=A3IRL7_9CHRO|nr:hypothetical protein [Crocosphaera chwakensis]EAZ90866.1 hypothetical protein CY0110_25586 [Crocosphaera chwakensis CCY0110]
MVLGNAVGSEYATLIFKDIDNDGISKSIVSSEFWGKYGLESCAADPWEIIIKVRLNNPPTFDIVEIRDLWVDT